MCAGEIKTGTIKTIIYDRGFGFINNTETKEDVFFHVTGCVDPVFNELKEEMKVNYLESTRNERPIAIGVVEI